MAHEITFNKQTGFSEMAYQGATPWHGLGQKVVAGSSIEEWQRAAGLDWEIKRSQVLYERSHVSQNQEVIKDIRALPKSDVLYRSDNGLGLAVVSERYQVVQPKEILEFFRKLVDQYGYEIETAGTLKEGRRIWALANTHLEADIVKSDKVKNFLLLSTSCDGSLATTAKFTSVRVVCNNTLQLSLNTDVSEGIVKVRHNTVFDKQKVHSELGFDAESTFNDFVVRMRKLSNTSVAVKQAEEVIQDLLKTGLNDPKRHPGFNTIMQLFQGAGKGSKMDGVAGTAWGIVNAVTEYIDFHARARNQSNRLDSAWFGANANTKSRILELVGQI